MFCIRAGDETVGLDMEDWREKRSFTVSLSAFLARLTSGFPDSFCCFSSISKHSPFIQCCCLNTHTIILELISSISSC